MFQTKGMRSHQWIRINFLTFFVSIKISLPISASLYSQLFWDLKISPSLGSSRGDVSPRMKSARALGLYGRGDHRSFLLLLG